MGRILREKGPTAVAERGALRQASRSKKTVASTAASDHGEVDQFCAAASAPVKPKEPTVKVPWLLWNR